MNIPVHMGCRILIREQFRCFTFCKTYTIPSKRQAFQKIWAPFGSPGALCDAQSRLQLSSYTATRPQNSQLDLGLRLVGARERNLWHHRGQLVVSGFLAEGEWGGHDMP